MKKIPLIGITSSYEINHEVENAHKTTLSIDYSKAVIASGGIPVILPVQNDRNLIKELVKNLDGLILAGGGDPDPLLYGEECLQGLGEITPERDEFEYIILEEFEKTKKPILGICRGLQLANVYYGGTLYQDIKYVDTNIQHKQKIQLYLPTHTVNITEKDNIFYEIFGEKTRVNSFHHQMIKDLAPTLTAIGTSPDGIIEIIQKKDYPFFYATQWHPEMMSVRGNENMKKIFDKFLEECKK